MTDDWFETMDQGLYTGVIFLDLRKAFDVVNLDLLVTKVQMFGCSSPALLWLKSYLPDRRQCANITGTLSDTEVLRSAVPQGLSFGSCPLPPIYQRPSGLTVTSLHAQIAFQV